MSAIDFSQLTPVQVKYLSLGLKAFIDKYVAVGLTKIPNLDIDTPLYNFASAALLFNAIIRDSTACMPVAGSIAVKMTIDDSTHVVDPVFGPIFGFELLFSYSVTPAGVVDVRIDTLARKYIGSGYAVPYDTLTDIVYVASLEVFKVKLGTSNIVEVPTPILDSIDPNATKQAQFLITEGMTYGNIFNFLYAFTESALTNFKIRYVNPYL